MSNAYHKDSQKHAITGQINHLMSELQQLAPHPDRPDYNGPLLINNTPHFKVANDHDGMMGTVILESLLGAAFSDAISDICGRWTEQFDGSAILEAYSEYITDIEQSTRKAAAHGQGTMARMAGKSIANSFNMRSNISPALQAFYDDMPKRITIETQLAECAKRLEHLERPSVPFSAPRPKFAA